MGLNFDQLAQETIALSEAAPLSCDLSSLKDKLEDKEDKHDQIDGPGVIFYFDRGISTFCLRGFASEDLEWEQERLDKNDPQFLRFFRLKDEWHEDQFIFYPTESFTDAEIIAEHMMGKRFPREEAVLCNLSDPGFSWWLDESSHRLEIFYQSQMIERDRDLIQLGPLGDPMLAAKRFSNSLGFLKSSFVVNEFSSTDKSFTVSTTQTQSQGFIDFKNIFLQGLAIEKDFSVLSHEERSHYLFLREIALLRSFWLKTQELLQRASQ